MSTYDTEIEDVLLELSRRDFTLYDINQEFYERWHQGPYMRASPVADEEEGGGVGEVGEVGEGDDESDEGMVGADELEEGEIREVDPVEEGDLREEEASGVEALTPQSVLDHPHGQLEYWWQPALASVGHSWYHFVEVWDPEASLLDAEGQRVVEEYYTHLEGVARHAVAIGVPISQLNLATHLMIEGQLGPSET
ncbi:hypothetical protein BV22DRAFT_1135774 [Leucogyrophana mollusca]|uniref:Uncharacterized protein n=1 Tax=Leucogyrophana mollusca TaxID=85980 RepID=A0ACB8AUW0_9AGAM|nr:hypothetical protein BV22DRAFT_1135774 [Leucogyrophana mollusca]